MISMLPPPLCLTVCWHSHVAFRKQLKNNLIDLISEPLGGENNSYPRALEKGRERGRDGRDHGTTLNNVTVWIMRSLCAGASTGLMTETCFRLCLTQTHAQTCIHGHNAKHTETRGPISSDNVLPAAGRTLGGNKGGRGQLTHLQSLFNLLLWIVMCVSSVSLHQFHSYYLFKAETQMSFSSGSGFPEVHNISAMHPYKFLLWCRSATCCQQWVHFKKSNMQW